jgi:hypothetical protein
VRATVTDMVRGTVTALTSDLSANSSRDCRPRPRGGKLHGLRPELTDASSLHTGMGTAGVDLTATASQSAPPGLACRHTGPATGPRPAASRNPSRSEAAPAQRGLTFAVSLAFDGRLF